MTLLIVRGLNAVICLSWKKKKKKNRDKPRMPVWFLWLIIDKPSSYGYPSISVMITEWEFLAGRIWWRTLDNTMCYLLQKPRRWGLGRAFTHILYCFEKISGLKCFAALYICIPWICQMNCRSIWSNRAHI